MNPIFEHLLSKIESNVDEMLILSIDEKMEILRALFLDNNCSEDLKEEVFYQCTRIELETSIGQHPDSPLVKEIQQFISDKSIGAEKLLRELVDLEEEPIENVAKDVEFDSTIWLNYQDPQNNYTILQNALHMGVTSAFIDELISFFKLTPEAIFHLLEAKDLDGNTELHLATKDWEREEPSLQVRCQIIETIFSILQRDPKLIHKLLSVKNNNGCTPFHFAMMNPQVRIIELICDIFKSEHEMLLDLVNTRVGARDGLQFICGSLSHIHSADIKPLLILLSRGVLPSYSMVVDGSYSSEINRELQVAYIQGLCPFVSKELISLVYSYLVYPQFIFYFIIMCFIIWVFIPIYIR